jgi:hypothetical protein
VNKNYIGLSAVLLLTACTAVPLSADEETKSGPRPNEAEAQKAVMAYVQDAGFKDPDSVQIKDVVINRPFKMYRGLVNGGGWDYGWEIDFQENGKNSFGGYVGYEPRQILLAPDGSVHWQLQLE